MAQRIPQGIEVLVLKAAIDPEFKELLLARPTEAAATIRLELGPAEASMLAAVPREQLEAIIARSSVPQEHRRAFLGQAAAAMLAALGVAGGNAESAYGFGGLGGIRPEGPNAPRPAEKTSAVEQRVVGLIAGQFKLDKAAVTRDKDLVKDLGAKPIQFAGLRKTLEKEFKIKLPADVFKKAHTVGDLVDYVSKAVENRSKPDAPRPDPRPQMLGGSRPDQPPPGASGGMRAK